MSRRIDLNVDVGEGFAFDRDLLDLATSANVCAGGHAGSEALTMDTVELCRSRNVRVGVHPGYPDRATMGRRSMRVEEHHEFLGSVFHQVKRFVGLARPSYLKPHGAFYNDTAVVLPGGWDQEEGR